MKEIFQQLTGFWKKLGANQKASVLLVGIVSIIAFGGIIFYAQKPQYQYLIGDVSTETHASIIRHLEEERIPYYTDGGGIFVPQNQQSSVRAAIVDNGILTEGSEGFSLFDKSSLSLTKFQEQINYYRAISGELEQTIRQMTFVRSARVLITMPKERLYTRDEQVMTASVALFLQPGKIPTRAQVESIRNFVSGAVPGLGANNVTVTDQTGRTLAQPREDGLEAMPAGLAADKFEFKKMVDSDLTKKAQDLLDRSFGVNKTIVAVDATINDPPKITSSKKYDKKAPLKTEQKTDSSKPIAGAKTGAATISDGLIPGTPTTETTNASENPKETLLEEKKEYWEPSWTMTQDVPTGFSIARLNVSLAVDSTLQDKANDVVALVKGTIGWTTDRGAGVGDADFTATVTDIPQETLIEAEEPGLLEQGHIIEIAKYGIQGLVVLMLVFFLRGMIKRAGKKKTAEGGIEDEGALPPEVLKRIQARRSTEALMSSDAEGSARVARNWATANK